MGDRVNDLALTGRQALEEVAASRDIAALDDVRVRWLGKKGTLTEQLKTLGALPRRAAARRASASTRRRSSVQARIDARKRRRSSASASSSSSLSGRIDVTLPGRGEERGGLHPVTQARLRIETLFRRAGFDVATGPRDRRRLPQLRGAEHSRGPSGAGDARHVLFPGRAAAAHAHLAGADSRAAGARRAACGDRAGPRVSRRFTT